MVTREGRSSGSEVLSATRGDSLPRYTEAHACKTGSRYSENNALEAPQILCGLVEESKKNVLGTCGKI